MCLWSKNIRDLVCFLDNTSDTLEGEFTLTDNDSDAFIHIVCSKGHVTISGQIGGSDQEQYMKFSFDTDQTVLKSFSRDFKKVLQNLV